MQALADVGARSGQLAGYWPWWRAGGPPPSLASWPGRAVRSGNDSNRTHRPRFDRYLGAPEDHGESGPRHGSRLGPRSDGGEAARWRPLDSMPVAACSPPTPRSRWLLRRCVHTDTMVRPSRPLAGSQSWASPGRRCWRRSWAPSRRPAATSVAPWSSDHTDEVGGGSAWESNPPTDAWRPSTGVEDQETHRDLSTPPT
jgi:hypothetical protein